MGPERLEDLPDHLVRLVVVERLVGSDARRDDDGQDDVASGLARGLPHHAADGLDHVHLGVARREEQHGVERGHVHALGEAAHVAQDPAGVVRRIRLKPVDLHLLLRRVHAAVDMLRLAAKGQSLLGLR